MFLGGIEKNQWHEMGLWIYIWILTAMRGFASIKSYTKKARLRNKNFFLIFFTNSKIKHFKTQTYPNSLRLRMNYN